MENYDSYINLLRERLSNYRLNHSLEVAKSAKYLAEKYGGDSEKMYLAGLLHDIFKEADEIETFYYAEKYGMDFSPLERNTKKLWHAMVGAEYIKHELNITDEEIITAVRYHTTARAGMSLHEKILFIADFISADRDYNGVERMREKAEVSLESAIIEGLSFSIAELAENEKPIHPDSVAAYNEVVLNYKKRG